MLVAQESATCGQRGRVRTLQYEVAALSMQVQVNPRATCLQLGRYSPRRDPLSFSVHVHPMRE